MRIAKGVEGWILTPFILGLISLLFLVIIKQSILIILSIIFFTITVLFLLFFRDPDRIIGKGIVSPADGRIQEIIEIDDKDVGSCFRITIFMNLYDVHVNRIPIDGRIIYIKHYPGSHTPAFRKESERNERIVIKIDTVIGMIKIIQIAGIIARRIKPYIKVGDKLEKGSRIGIIKLGSRVDLYLPRDKIVLKVKKSDRVKAGVDSIAEIDD